MHTSAINQSQYSLDTTKLYSLHKEGLEINARSTPFLIPKHRRKWILGLRQSITNPLPLLVIFSKTYLLAKEMSKKLNVLLIFIDFLTPKSISLCNLGSKNGGLTPGVDLA